MILIIKHIPIEGPETLADFFAAKEFDLKTVDLSQGERLPADLSGLQEKMRKMNRIPKRK